MGDLTICIVLPVLRLGPVTVDPVEALLGVSLTEVFGSLLQNTWQTRRGRELLVRLPSHTGATLPLGVLGEVSFRNDGGLLVLGLPQVVAQRVERALGNTVVHRTIGPASTVELSIDLPSTHAVDLPIAGVATITLERVDPA